MYRLDELGDCFLTTFTTGDEHEPVADRLRLLPQQQPIDQADQGDRRGHRRRDRRRATRRRRRHPPAQRPPERLCPLRGRVRTDRRQPGLALLARRPRRPDGTRVRQSPRQPRVTTRRRTRSDRPQPDSHPRRPAIRGTERHPRLLRRRCGRRGPRGSRPRRQDPEGDRKAAAALPATGTKRSRCPASPREPSVFTCSGRHAATCSSAPTHAPARATTPRSPPPTCRRPSSSTRSTFAPAPSRAKNSNTPSANEPSSTPITRPAHSGR